MKRKIYTSRSVLHFSVGGTRVAFTPLSSNSSYYETRDEALQERIEKHPWFGDKFVLKETHDIDESKPAKKAEKQEGVKEMTKKAFSTLADAKEWLAKEYGVARSNIKKREDAERVGKSFGVEIAIGVRESD